MTRVMIRAIVRVRDPPGRGAFYPSTRLCMSLFDFDLHFFLPRRLSPCRSRSSPLSPMCVCLHVCVCLSCVIRVDGMHTCIFLVSPPPFLDPSLSLSQFSLPLSSSRGARLSPSLSFHGRVSGTVERIREIEDRVLGRKKREGNGDLLPSSIHVASKDDCATSLSYRRR